MRCLILRRLSSSATNVASQQQQPIKKVIFSGIQPTSGVPHLGNYLGALRPWVELQNSGAYSHVIFSIVDLHAMTSPKKSDSLKQNSIEMACSLLACGIDPNKSCLYRQSNVPEHVMLYWLFACNSTLARLYHFTQWRQKAGLSTASDDSNMPAVGVGLYTYPILQAADILLYKATHVPVGEDQLQHLRLTQEIARKFNNTIFPRPKSSKEPPFFPVPEPMLNQETARVHSLRDPAVKMSKSDPDKRSRIELDDDADAIRAKLRKAVTDTHSKVSFDPNGRPGVSNLIAIHAALSGKSVDTIVKEVGDSDTGKYKMVVAECIIETLRPIRNRFMELRSDPAVVERILNEGAQKARVIAEKNWKEIAQLLSFH